jgi:hypothetical protein
MSYFKQRVIEKLAAKTPPIWKGTAADAMNLVKERAWTGVPTVQIRKELRERGIKIPSSSLRSWAKQFQRGHAERTLDRHRWEAFNAGRGRQFLDAVAKARKEGTLFVPYK